MRIGIYLITSPSGRKYIGQSTDIDRRWSHYLKYGTNKSQRKLYRSFEKYGVINHQFEIVEECSIGQLDDREIYWGTIYEVLIKGLNSKLGRGKGIVSDESCKLMSESKMGNKNPNFGKPKSEEVRKKLSDTLKGRPRTEETKAKLSRIHKGRISNRRGVTLSQETKDKIRLANINKKPTVHTQATKDRLSAMKKGIKLSEAHKQALRDAKRGFTVRTAIQCE